MKFVVEDAVVVVVRACKSENGMAVVVVPVAGVCCNGEIMDEADAALLRGEETTLVRAA